MTAAEPHRDLPSRGQAERRHFERTLLILLLGVIVWAMLDRARDMRSAAELGAFRHSLGALRVALVLERMRAAAGAQPAATPSASPVGATPNPFLLLARQPANYAGNIALIDAQADAIAPGAWFHDGNCPCIGYRLRDDQRFLAASGARLMVFRLSPPGVLVAREPYLWRGEVID